MEAPIPRGCKSIEEAVALIEAMKQDGLHEYARDDQGYGPGPLYSVKGPSRFTDSQFIYFKLGSTSSMTPGEISAESIRLIWLLQVARWETKHQKEWRSENDNN